MIKKLLGSVREYKLATLLTPLAMVGEVLCECIIPYFTARLINIISKDATMDQIVKYGLLLLTMAFASLTFGCISGWFAAKASAGFAKNLRHDLFYKVQDFSFSNIDSFSSSSLVTRLTTDVTNVQNAFMMIIRVAVRSPLMLIIAVVMSVNVGGKLAFVFAGTIPILAFTLFNLLRKCIPLFKNVFKKYDALNNSVQENVHGIRVVKSFVREDFEEKKFEKASGDIKNDFVRIEKILALNAPVMTFCMYASSVLISFFAAKTIIKSSGKGMNVGNLTSMIQYSMMILMSLMMLSMIFVMISIASESAKRIVEVLSAQSDITAPADAVTAVKDGSIDFENVSFKYSKDAKNNALSNINFHIDSGMTVGIIGGTGSGKSSLIQLISRLYDATEGSVKVGGVDVRKYDLVTLRDKVSVVLQKNVLFSGTVKSNLLWGDRTATDEEIKTACKAACADEFIESFPDKYNTRIEQGGSNVSGGQKQRLCIARALLKKPKILILDDSTSAVDTRTDAKIRKAFKEYIPETTKIIIAQRITSIMDSDLILVMNNGTVEAIGKHDDLMNSNSTYREVYESQNKAGGEQNG
ncbi:MAG: ABC transporter ATP-binding protein/permease [Lachnospiraceae bacterium]|nr:ABC transporter ATP-binding protein/permease [Lachnospiraceae bacterium]